MKNAVVVLLLLVSLFTSGSARRKPVDCHDIHRRGGHRSGVYHIYPRGKPVKVYCDMSSSGGWTVFQRRMDGTVNFYRPWNQYKAGFGNVAKEHWLGLQNLHLLTRARRYELLVTVTDFNGHKAFARYSYFSVRSECEGYKLTVSGFRNGGAGDSLSYHNGQKFSTFDNDQDSWPGNCARSFLGAFWYKSCHFTNPNGVYRWGADGTLFAVGVDWYHYRGYNYSLKSISMKIRPVH